MKRWMLLFLIVFLVGIIIGCNYNNPSDRDDIENAITMMNPINYGNGVYYFPVTGSTFGKSLSYFIEKNKDKLELVSISADDSNKYGYTSGYFVVFKEK